ncbi:uncharacterized protein EV422DRAFT_536577 [Fimicolochytrium jonesii]|uniref:uncharacterized protein n=1 Tax=Fimicolochytrium jonesii TaxID=1396493 RepID=UPI0022FDC0F1|nr:uncharacterized protein EV422DRAFT_536577 [Fimicolochytrium jonesii]KAI8818704.1 hypothetical protein EV422DRAFT_536577 [Fimicolochytrium jonesii]
MNTDIGASSFRAGGATHLAILGYDTLWIQRWGRWSSDAFERYIRTHPSVHLAVRQNSAPITRPVVY